MRWVCTACLLVLSLRLSAQAWDKADKDEFILSCVASAQEDVGENLALQYCYCMLDELMATYPNVEDTEDLTEEEITPTAVSCMASLNAWDDETKDAFLSDCFLEAEKAMTQEQASDYCNCMLYKLALRFPNVEDYNLGEEELTDLATSCLR